MGGEQFQQFVPLPSRDVAAAIVEPVQGEGGLTPATDEFLRELERRCREVGAYLIVDEVQSGFGRTGLIWDHLRANVRPDILVAGKSIGGGFPVSLVAVNDDIASKVEEGEHGSTHGGNPLALAAVTGGVEAHLSDDVPSKAHAASELLFAGLREVAAENAELVRTVKGKGLMVGLELRFNPSQAIKDLQSKGLLTLKAGTTVLRFLPPYMITQEDVEWAVARVAESLAEL
jgi:acetylornithine/LysW-gamma-L-lysine aminotransferase